MSDDLVKRLRTDINETDTFERRKNWTEQRSERRKAADRIQALTAENERLREALGELSGNTGKLASRENENG